MGTFSNYSEVPFVLADEYQASELSDYDRDIVIRTVLGEAANQGPDGQAAVAHVIRNRVLSKRFPNTPAKVALQNNGTYYQFSAWNSTSREGNNLVHKYSRGDSKYDEIGLVVDKVFSGQVPDLTGGATHYYSPAGMTTGRAPSWWKEESRIGGGSIQIGAHVFAGNPDKAGSYVNANIAQSTQEVNSPTATQYPLGIEDSDVDAQISRTLPPIPQPRTFGQIYGDLGKNDALDFFNAFKNATSRRSERVAFLDN